MGNVVMARLKNVKSQPMPVGLMDVVFRFGIVATIVDYPNDHRTMFDRHHVGTTDGTGKSP